MSRSGPHRMAGGEHVRSVLVDSSALVRIVYANRDHHRAARAWLAKLGDQRITYADAVSFAVMSATAVPDGAHVRPRLPGGRLHALAAAGVAAERSRRANRATPAAVWTLW